MKKRIAALLAAFALVFCMPLTAFAAGAFDDGGSQAVVSSGTEHNAGNMFALMHPVSGTDVENDLYWAGQTLDANKVNVGTSGHGSILAAGQKVTLKNVTVADSVRVAAQDITIDHAQITNNITIAAQDISLGNEVKANGLYAAAKNLDVAGNYKGGMLSGENVSFNGVVDGDLTISAENISIEGKAQVTGTLVVPEGVNVSIAEGAQVPNVSYSAPIQIDQPTIFDNALTILYACMAHIVLVGLFFLVIRKSLVRSANMARTQLVKMLLAGLIIFLVMPLVCLVLIFPLITIPVVVLLVLVMVIIALFSLPFTGSALGLMLWGKRMNPVLAAIIGTLILTIFAYIPILSVLTVIFCIIFTAGYLWFCYWEAHQERKQERLAAQQAAYAPPFAAGSADGVSVSPAPGNDSSVPPAPAGEPVAPPAPSGEPTIPAAPSQGTDAAQPAAPQPPVAPGTSSTSEAPTAGNETSGSEPSEGSQPKE